MRKRLISYCLAVFVAAASVISHAADQPASTPATRPAIFLIGDSTIRNGSYDNGATAGQFGWGHVLHYYFNTSRIYVVNDAMGGTSSRSFQTSPTLWPLVAQKIVPGDFVLMAFGHNDSGNSIRGNGDETQPFTGRGATPGETMHSFGWYMRQYIEQTKAKGATPIVLSLIPRNRWTNGKVNRSTNDYALWARQAAEQEKVAFIPLNDLIADKYEALGQARVTAELFPPNEVVHPNWAGAALNASLVVDAIKALPDCPLQDFLVKDAKVPPEPDVRPPARGEMGPTAGMPGDRPPLLTTMPAVKP